VIKLFEMRDLLFRCNRLHQHVHNQLLAIFGPFLCLRFFRELQLNREQLATGFQLEGHSGVSSSSLVDNR